MTDRTPSITECLHAVAVESDISLALLLSRSRIRRYARCRQISMWLAKAVSGKSLVQIGRVIGNRDHTTVMHAIQTIDGLRLHGEKDVVRISNAALHRVMADPRQVELAI